MPASERSWVTFTIDGLEVRAPEGEWLLDAAKRGDVEIPYFCYEPKLGAPVGACRMCMVEVEGIPKLQVSCATPVKDGMVVNTQTDRVKEAQNAVVEFLLINHPLDCPVCDKGGECPLQDITFGWGPGRSRFVEKKRNFPKPIALSPLVAIDRERCILCYRCVRFSQEVSEDYHLTFLERADHTFVGTFDGRPYVAPFAGNIIELCPVGALTSTPYRFRARPWEIEDSGSVCTFCPSQCNIKFTVRDERVERVLARQNDDVDNGWLCDKGRYGYQSVHSEQRIDQPLVRDGGMLRPASWERALRTAADGLRKAGAASGAIIGGSTTNEEGYLLQRVFREALGSSNIDSRRGGSLDPRIARMLSRPELQAQVSDLDHATVVLAVATDPLNESPIIDLRVRKAVRRFGAKLIVAAAHPTALDGGATEVLSFKPGGEEAFLRAFAKAMRQIDQSGGAEQEQPRSDRPPEEAGAPPLPGQPELLDFLDHASLDSLSELAGVVAQDVRDAANLLVGAENIVVLWGERLGDGEQGAGALAALADVALLAGLDGGRSSGLIEIPAGTNARGLREVGCLPNMGPGLSAREPGMNTAEIRGAAARGELEALYLLHADPMRNQPDRLSWEAALGNAFVVAHDQFLSESIERHAEVVFPAESYAEKEGTVTHPDGRLQRLRPAIGHPGAVRMEWQVIVELALELGLDLPYLTTGTVLAEIAEQVPFYRGASAEEIGAKGLRWPERELADEALRSLGELRFSAPSEPPPPLEPVDGRPLVVPVASLWASWETERSPALRFLSPKQELRLNPSDAKRLGITHGELARVAANGRAIHATVRLAANARAGWAYLLEGTAEDAANVLTPGGPVAVEITRVSDSEPAPNVALEAGTAGDRT